MRLLENFKRDGKTVEKNLRGKSLEQTRPKEDDTALTPEEDALIRGIIIKGILANNANQDQSSN